VVPEEPEEPVKEKKVLFQGLTGNLYLLNADGTKRPLVFKRNEHQSISFASLSPNGDKIAMDIWNQNINIASLSVFDIANNTTREIKRGTHHGGITRGIIWSPDNKKLLYSCRETAALWISPIKGGNPIMIGEGRVNRIINNKNREIWNFYSHLNFLDCSDKVLFSHASWFRDSAGRVT